MIANLMDPPNESSEQHPSSVDESASLFHSTQRTKPSSPRLKKSRSSRLGLVLLFVLVFLRNSINSKKIIKSVNSQFEYWQTSIEQQPSQVENKTEEIAIIISSSSIPTLPSTYMVNMVLNSTDRLIGLSPTAPIFITVDHFRFTDYANTPPALKERIDKLEQYTINLFNQYLTNPRIHIIPAMKNLHIGGSVLKAMNLIERHYPTVRYLYYLQHDFVFSKDVDHTALINVMDQYPDKVNYVRFPKRPPYQIGRVCADEKPITFNRTDVPSNNLDADGVHNETAAEGGSKALPINPSPLIIYPSKDYSDNNHLVRLSWYKAMIISLIYLERAPEDPMQKAAYGGCHGGKPIGVYIFGEQNIVHLDGRHSTSTP